MNVLVMGGSQFVNQAIAKGLIKSGYKVDIFARGRSKVNYEGYFEQLTGDRTVQQYLAI